ncbi:hypothetical protein EDD11_002175 [Mortierella claussenii]|nr:hypothetical protein EDD11_002175 [Mortierella claussenii]
MTLSPTALQHNSALSKSVEGDRMDASGFAESTNSLDRASVEKQQADHDPKETQSYQSASSSTVVGSTIAVDSHESAPATQHHESTATTTVDVTEEHEGSATVSLDSSETATQQTKPIKNSSSSAATAVPSPAGHQPPERHIPSYEQWRKQVLEKKKPTNPSERKQRKRKPYQESAVDVAIGAEDELGFVFPNLDNGSGKNGDDRFQHVSDQLGNGPDLKQDFGKDRECIKAEYAKDPKDRFNHASATCAASVVKASKDATSITAILNEGKDHYMLNKCMTKDKFFVVELCEEILVDTFILGNYEFFSSTFKNFIVSVNRYPPRDDGWRILGHFQARNTRDAQVFKPAVPQLATYIRFDFLSHYGNEYYCPVTLLRVYGATALEQLKQEEEEEKRLAEEERRLAELEKVRQETGDADEVEDASDTEEAEVIEADEPGSTGEITSKNDMEQLVVTDGARGEQASFSRPSHTTDGLVATDSYSAVSSTAYPTDAVEDHAAATRQEHELEGADMDMTESSANIPTHIEPFVDEPPTLLSSGRSDSDADAEETILRDDSTAGHVALSDTILKSFETSTTSEEFDPSDILPPRASTSPASLQDDGHWGNTDLGMITLSSKTRPTQLLKPLSGSKPSSAGVGTIVGGPASMDSSVYPSPTPQHSSQESVYKNIVNRLKVLELNSSLSYLYLEEQSNIFNEVIESSEQKINQLVSHLNEATRRLETLGRKYDQLAYSYRAHVEVDGEKSRQDFIRLSMQVHVLGSQVVFQRQLVVIVAIAIFSIFTFFAITRSTSMHYALQQSPLAAKLRAISGQKRVIRSENSPSSIRIGSVEGLTQFDQNSLLLPHSSEEHPSRAEESSKHTPPISPISPLTPNPNHDVRPSLFSDDDLPVVESPRLDSTVSFQNGTVADDEHDQPPTYSRPELNSLQTQHVESPDLENPSNPQLQGRSSLLVTRTPYPTPKNSYGHDRLFLHSHHHSSSQNDYRPDSPVFQGPSCVHDEGQLSDADVAYMSRDMNVGRKNSSGPGSIINPAVRRLSVGYQNHVHHNGGHHPSQSFGASRPLSSLRMDATASLAVLGRSDSSDSSEAMHPFSGESSQGLDHTNDRTVPLDASTHEQTGVSCENDHQAMECANSSNGIRSSLTRTPEMSHKGLIEEEDVGFVSDSVLDSVSENMAGRKHRLLRSADGTLSEWDKQHGVGEALLKDDPETEEGEEVYAALSQVEVCEQDTTTNSYTNTIPAPCKEAALVKEQQPQLARDSSFRSKRSSHNILRTPDFSTNTSRRNHSISDVLGLGVGLGLDVDSEQSPSLQDTMAREYQDGTTATVPSLERRISTGPAASASAETAQSYRNGTESTEDDDGIQADDDSAVVPTVQALSERRKRSKRPSLPDDMTGPWRRVSSSRRESGERQHKTDGDDRALEGDDERSPQVSRKA